MRKPGVLGQNLVEVSIFLALVVGVITSMQLYLQRSFQARYKAGADYVHKQLASGLPGQYQPYYSQGTQTDNTSYHVIKGYPESLVEQSVTRTAFSVTAVPSERD